MWISDITAKISNPIISIQKTTERNGYIIGKRFFWSREVYFLEIRDFYGSFYAQKEDN